MIKYAVVKKYKNAVIAIFLLVLLLGGLNIYINRAHIKLYFEKLGLITRKEPFTELYFINPDSLKHQMEPGDKIEFQFRISDQEGTPKTYNWTSYVLVTSSNGDTKKIQIGAGQADLNHGEFKDQVVYSENRFDSGRMKIVVELKEPPQSIHYYSIVK